MLDRIAKALNVRPKYLNTPTFRNYQEFAYSLLENEDVFGRTVRNIDGTAAIATRHGPTINFFGEVIHGWKGTHKKLDDHEIIKDIYEEWKRTWNNSLWFKTSNGKNPYTNK